MNFSVEHIAIPAADPAELTHWYQRVLGAKLIWENGQNPPTFLISLGNIWFEIYAAEISLTNRSNNKLAGFRHLALRVDSLETARTELIRRGVIFSEETKSAAGGGRVLFFVDPEGNPFHLVERPADSALDAK